VTAPVADEVLGRELRHVLRPDQVRLGAVDRVTYGYDATYRRGLPAAVVFPESTEDVSAVLRLASRLHVPVFPRGAGTGLSGGAVPMGGIALVLTRMRSISVEPEAMQLVAEAGATTADVQAAAAAHGLYYPPDPGSQHVATVGGNIAENAAGPHGLRYGATDRYVLGLTVVLPNGEVLETGGRTLKNATGYRLTQLFVGSEGTLGVITRARLRLVPKPPPDTATLLLGFAGLSELGRAVGQLARLSESLVSLELLDRHTIAAVAGRGPVPLPEGLAGVLLAELRGYKDVLPRLAQQTADLARAAGAVVVQVAVEREAQAHLWRMREEVAAAVARLKPTKISEDATVPLDELAGFLADLEAIRREYRVELVVFGHAGDGNVHPNILCREGDAEEMTRVEAAVAAIFQAALRRGGTLSGEHGIGLLKRDFLPHAVSPAALWTMRELKRLFDPQGILNPGKLLPSTGGEAP
jgi:glycolate oxidase